MIPTYRLVSNCLKSWEFYWHERLRFYLRIKWSWVENLIWTISSVDVLIQNFHYGETCETYLPLNTDHSFVLNLGILRGNHYCWVATLTDVADAIFALSILFTFTFVLLIKLIISLRNCLVRLLYNIRFL